MQVDGLATSRRHAERAEQERHKCYVSDSSRSRKLQRLAEALRYQADELTRAMLASTTIDDEIPF